jgi:hypothetical protein
VIGGSEPLTKAVLTPATLVKQYIALRRKCEEIEKEANERMKPFDEAMKTLEVWLQAYLGADRTRARLY